MPRADAFPVEAVRDLLGIARALYAAKKRELASQPVLEELAEIGRKLSNALKLAKSGADTIGARSAREQAEEACQRLGRVVGSSLPAAVVVEAAVVRVRRIGPRHPSEREEKRAAAKIRS